MGTAVVGFRERVPESLGLSGPPYFAAWCNHSPGKPEFIGPFFPDPITPPPHACVHPMHPRKSAGQAGGGAHVTRIPGLGCGAATDTAPGGTGGR